MQKLYKIDLLLLAGFLGFVILLYVACVNPVALNNADLSDLSPMGILLKVAAAFAVAGLLAFFHGIPSSLRDTRRNICRLIYASGFGAASYCASSEWHCFLS